MIQLVLKSIKEKKIVQLFTKILIEIGQRSRIIGVLLTDNMVYLSKIELILSRVYVTILTRVVNYIIIFLEPFSGIFSQRYIYDQFKDKNLLKA